MSKKNLITIIIALVVLVVAGFSIFSSKNAGEPNASTENDGKRAKTSISATDENGDMVIPIADITEKATFYSYDELDNTMEIIAVKANDGTIRTAFNTCQVCYSSGRGYYVQEGDELVCQNCGNRFAMDQVEVAKGGCNPVPIFEEQKEVNADTIKIKKDFFQEAEVIFENWKI